MKHLPVLLVTALLFSATSFSQNQYQNDDDTTNQLSTVDGIVHSLYNAISGPAGQQRDWNTFMNLFAPDARMYIAVTDKNSGGTVLKSITPNDYEQRNESRLADIGFTEKELHRVANSYGAGTQVFSTYESHYTNNNGEEDIIKGINNIQLFFDGNRYYIVSIFWDADAKNIEVPQRYLSGNNHTDYEINL